MANTFNSESHLFSAAQCKQLDKLASEKFGIPSLLLMKRAAWHTWQIIQAHYPEHQNLDILCGTGNNGGDGFALAQFAQLQGKKATIWLYGNPVQIANDALITFHEAKQLAVKIQPFSHFKPNSEHLTVDALFGIGLNRPLNTELQVLIMQLNQSGSPVIAMDIPTGLDCDTGTLWGKAIKADHTCTFIANKTGLYSLNGRDYCGQIHLFDLGVPKDAYQLIPTPIGKHTLDYWLAKKTQIKVSHHKGSAGRNLIIGGNQNMQGALQIAASGCLHSGAGLTFAYSPDTDYLPQLPEIQCHTTELSTRIKQADAIAIGPGLGQNQWAQETLKTLLQQSRNKTLLLDADALNLLSQLSEEELNKLQQQMTRQHLDWILTPHPGEAARLLDCTIEQVQNDRISAIQTLQQQYGGTIVLKGNGSLIHNGEQFELCSYGNPGMAVGGMGDLLSGIICALLAQGMQSYSASCLGVFLHACAGDLAVQEYGQAGVTPSRMLKFIGKLLG